MTILGPPVGSVPPQGWYVEVDIRTPDGTGRQTVRPAVEGEPQWTPAVNEQPTVTLPVAPQEYFLNGRADSAPCRVWRDGEQLPIEEINRIERDVGNGRDTLSLYAIGGVELNRRVQRVYQNIPAYNAVRNLITSETNLVENVDDPKASSGGGGTTTLLSISTASEFRNNLTPLTAGDFTADTLPLVVDDTNDEIRRQQTSWLWAAGNATTATAGDSLTPLSPASTVTGVSGASHGTVIRWDDANADGGAQQSNTLPLAYDIPSGAVTVAVRVRASGSGADLSIVGYDGRGSTPPRAEIPLSTLPDSSFVWLVRSVSTDTTDFASGDDLQVSALTADGTNPSYQVDVDAMAIWDSRLNHEGGGLDANDNLTRPRPYGTVSDAVRFETSDPQLSTTTLDGARTDLTINGTDNVEASATMAGTTRRVRDSIATVEPGELADRASGGAGLAGFGSQNASPAEGISQHVFSGFDLAGLTTAEQRLIGSDFDDDILTVLQDISDTVGAIFAVGVDSGELSLEWSRLGLRDSQGQLSATAVSLAREMQTVRAATVIGGRVQRRQEFTAPSPGGGSVALDNDRLVASTERVATQSGSTTYEAVTDYQIDYIGGSLSVPSGSALSGGESLVIEYQYRPTGRFEGDAWSGDSQTDQSIDIPTVTTAGAAEQAARQVVRETSDARTEATVDLSEIDAGTSVVAALGIDRLTAISDAWRVAQFVDSPTAPQVKLSTARPVSQVVSQLEREFGNVRERI
jgi:hypothetical protein